MTVAAAPSRIAPETIADQLLEARARTLLLVAPLSDEDLRRQHDPLMSPILWDLGHIAHFEELWLTRNLDGPIEFVEMPGLYNPFEHPRSERGALALPGLEECRVIMDEIRGRVLARLVAADFDATNPLLRDGYVYQWFSSTNISTTRRSCRRSSSSGARPTRRSRGLRLRLRASARRRAPGEMVRFPGGTVEIGTDDRTAAYDNERPAHAVEWRRSGSTSHPVTNRRLSRLHRGRRVRDAGSYWSEAGWRWLQEAGAARAEVLAAAMDGNWSTRTMDRRRRWIRVTRCATSRYHEAEAFARFAGKRLPTEIEWEAAASWDPATGTSRRYPWGDEPPDRDARQRRSARLRHRSGRELSTQRLAHRLLRHDRRRLGVDLERFRRRGPGSRAFPTRSTPRCSSAPNTRSCAGARGPRGQAPFATRSVTGTTLSAARSSAASGAPAMPNLARTRAARPAERIRTPACWPRWPPACRRRRRSCRPSTSTTSAGSELFEEITRLPEYYPTRTERALLSGLDAGAHGRSSGTRTLIELGAGNAEKSRIILDAMRGDRPGRALRAHRRERDAS